MNEPMMEMGNEEVDRYSGFVHCIDGRDGPDGAATDGGIAAHGAHDAAVAGALCGRQHDA
ncbi:hypothetical protein BCAR13_320006 [Paraburkholderia caribensis]|nr:hypothetical protein BCAR13_320006 [Paraburkholderia caribensis]